MSISKVWNFPTLAGGPPTLGGYNTAQRAARQEDSSVGSRQRANEGHQSAGILASALDPAAWFKDLMPDSVAIESWSAVKVQQSDEKVPSFPRGCMLWSPLRGVAWRESSSAGLDSRLLGNDEVLFRIKLTDYWTSLRFQDQRT
jgi:hypothetical protein